MAAWNSTLQPPPFVEPRLAILEVARGEFAAAARRLARQRTVVERSLIPKMVGPYAMAQAELSLWKGIPLAARDQVREGLAGPGAGLHRERAAGDRRIWVKVEKIR
jgi:hypothetical protein